MASPILSRRRPRSEDDDDTESTLLSQASSPKRPRLDPADSEAEVTGEEDDEDESGDDQIDESEDEEKNYEAQSDAESTGSGASDVIANPPQVTLHAGLGPGGYKPGAIVRIKVKNFVTYTSAEFFPGPKLNMVIGPNGTGKSTLVCAICLGLGWGPQHLGRAKDLGEFVKHGSKEAIIEIELCGPPKCRRNPVIQRTIKRDGNKSSFLLDGQPASMKEVLKLAQSFAIQVDNLCQFLPQDKVAEFAALSPVELLHSTQRAAAGPEMLDWHKALKDLRSQQKKLEVDNSGDKDTLTNLENRQEMQRADVEKMRERAEIKRKIELLELCRPIVEYREHYEAVKAMRETKVELNKEYEQIKADNAPILRAAEAKEDYIAQLNGVKDDRKDALDHASAVTTECGKKIDDFDVKIKDLDGQIEAERKSSQSQKAEATKAQQTINKLERQLQEDVRFDPESFNEALREKRLQKRELETKAGEIKERRDPMVAEGRRLMTSVQEAELRLKNLDSAAGQQENKLERASPDSFKAYKWILENQDKFEKEVYGPPIVTCSVTDSKFADAVESIFQKTDFVSFTTQTPGDFRTLQRQLNGEMRLHDITIKTCSIPLDRFTAPMPNDQLRRLGGFDGWAKDFLAGPDPVIAMLCSEKNLHALPIGLRDNTDEEFNRLENGTLSSWVSGKNSFQVARRREYGPDAKSTRVRHVEQAKVWTSQPVDQTLKHQLEEQISGMKAQFEDLKQQVKSEESRGLRIKEDIDQILRDTKEIEQEKEVKQTAYTQYRAIPERISQQKAKLDNITSMFDGLRERVREYRNEQDEIAIQKAEAVIQYAEAIKLYRQAHEELVEIEIQFLEATSDLQTLRARNVDSTRLMEEKRIELQDINRKLKETTAKAKVASQKATQARRLVGEHPDGEEFVNALVEHDIDRLEAEISSEQARLELTHGGSSHLIKEFEDRERTIEKLRSKLTDFEAQVTELNTAIEDIRKDWEPRLEALIEKISDAFSDSFRRIGCAGQVTLGKAEDIGPNEFADWSIVIHVAFRQNIPLSVLNAHRQSGGERAVSTIFYLMALQSLSASPFRVVDEINQGMDPRNERMVHGRLVDIACASSEPDEIGGGGGGQYFLITPKLLNGLVYKPGMRVLCIYSGEHMPEDYGKIDFKKAIRNMATVAAGRRNGQTQAIQRSGRVDVYA